MLSIWEMGRLHLLEREWAEVGVTLQGPATGDGDIVMGFSWPPSEEGRLG